MRYLILFPTSKSFQISKLKTKKKPSNTIEYIFMVFMSQQVQLEPKNN